MRVARFRERAFAFLLDGLLVAALGRAMGLPALVWAGLLFLYTLLSLWLFAGRTPGKILLRLQVVGRDEARLTLLQAALRPVLYLVEIALLFGGFLFALFSRDRLALHDLLLGTQVVKLRRT